MKYRKRPIEIEAWRVPAYFRPSLAHAPQWLLDAKLQVVIDGIQVHTLEGTMLARPGDWVIKGIEGELYPCTNSIFDASYEAVP